MPFVSDKLEDSLLDLKAKAEILAGYMHHEDELLKSDNYAFYDSVFELLMKIENISLDTQASNDNETVNLIS